MKKIAVINLANIGNAGDNIIGEVTEFLIHGKYDVETYFVELHPNNKQLLSSGNIGPLIASYAYRAFTLKFLKQRGYETENKKFRLRLMRYYTKLLKGSDAIVFAVGMLKYTTQRLSYCFDIITEIADRYRIPVYMNALSIARTDMQDFRCRQLITAVNRDCVKMITTRDGITGLNRLREEYLHSVHTISDYVGDPALWIPECYQIGKHKSDTIGVGLVRQNIFRAYGKNVSDEELLRFYMDLIFRLDEDGAKWELFCNGMDEDYTFGKKIIERLNLSEEKLRDQPKNSVELVQLVSGYQAILGARLHACLTAVSLDVPVVGIIWDDKLLFFSETMGIQENFIDAEHMDGGKAAKKILELAKTGQQLKNKEEYRNRYIECLGKFLDEYVMNT